MGSIRRECCNYCMWFGPVNGDRTMRKHRPATLDDKWGRPNKVQDMSAEPCPGSNKPYARFGTVEEAIKDSQEATVIEPTTASTDTDEYVPSPEAAIAAARIALDELKAKGWKANPIYWVGRLESALTQTLKAIDGAEGEKLLAVETPDEEFRRTMPDIIHAAPAGTPTYERFESRSEASAYEIGDCASHGIEDKRGGRALELGAISVCESGTTYGAWSDSAGGFIYTGDCALDVANYAADELRTLAKDDDTDTIQILAVCPDHEEQPRRECEDCASDN